MSRGYHRRPRLTAERFVPDPDALLPGGRRYRTGDLGSVARRRIVPHPRTGRPAGEGARAPHRAARDRVGAGRAPRGGAGGGEARSTSAPRSGSARSSPHWPDADDSEQPSRSADLVAWLRERLPAYMIPAMLRVVDEVPLDPNGKVDRAALASPWARRVDLSGPATGTRRRRPRWRSSWPRSGRRRCRSTRSACDDNYFLLGGDSLRSIALLARVGELGFVVSAEEFLGHQSVAELAELHRRAGAGRTSRRTSSRRRRGHEDAGVAHAGRGRPVGGAAATPSTGDLPPVLLPLRRFGDDGVPRLAASSWASSPMSRCCRSGCPGGRAGWSSGPRSPSTG